MFKTPVSFPRLVAALLLCMPLIACKPGNPTSSGAKPDSTEAASATVTAKLDPILAEPKEGDLYATELTHFSAGDFEGAEKTFGLLKVVAVSPDNITAITETGAWPKKQGALNDLRGDLSGISWDESEKIVIKRAELSKLVADEKILEVRRLSTP